MQNELMVCNRQAEVLLGKGLQVTGYIGLGVKQGTLQVEGFWGSLHSAVSSPLASGGVCVCVCVCLCVSLNPLLV